MNADQEIPPHPIRARVVLVAAGSSTRMRRAGQHSIRKPWLDLGGRSVLEICIEAVSAPEEVTELVIVAHGDDLARVADLVRTSPAAGKLIAVIAGGAERADSVRLGARVPSSSGDRPEAGIDVIAVHDAARPLVDPATVSRAIRVAHREGAAVVALPVVDTIKESKDGLHAQRTLDRARLWAAQTPQCFRAQRFGELLQRAQDEGLSPTDDAALWERWVGPVPLVEGSPTNRKITTPEDLEFARAILRSRQESL